MESAPIQPATLLFVDDEPMSRKYFQRLFGDDYRVLLADSVAAAQADMDREADDIAVLVTDQRMPAEQGITLLEYARERYPLVTRVLSTAYTDLKVAIEAVNSGEIYRFVLKPWDMQRLRRIVGDAVRYHRVQRHEQDLIEGKREAMLALAASVVHEMRTPLAAIQLGAEALARHLPTLLDAYDWAQARGGVGTPLSEPQRRGLARITDNIGLEASQATMVVEALLYAVRDTDADTGSGGNDLCRLSMATTLNQTLDRYPFPPSRRKQVSIDVVGDFEYRGHAELMVFVFYNMLRNAMFALAAANKGEVRLQVGHDSGGGWVLVRDTGTGIAAEHLPHIFDEYYSTREVGSGNGLGLPFCRRVLRRFGATISVTSVLGEFTEFRLSFPPLTGGQCP